MHVNSLKCTEKENANLNMYNSKTTGQVIADEDVPSSERFKIVYNVLICFFNTVSLVITDYHIVM